MATKKNLEILKKDIESELRLLKWMMGTTMGGIIAILIRLFIK